MSATFRARVRELPLLRTLAGLARTMREDVAAARARDPAARGIGLGQILLSYAGVQAVIAHRVAHTLHRAGIPVASWALAHCARVLTGVEIHPAARIGAGLFIDHGAGVVIGETAEIGEDVTLYQGVTLGGTGFARGKRHPTVDRNVVIGSGAKLLGPVRVGRGSKIGANSVVIHDVPANCTAVGNPAHPVRVNGRKPQAGVADWAHLPDPVADAIQDLAERVAALDARTASRTAQHRQRRARALRPKPRSSDPAGG